MSAFHAQRELAHRAVELRKRVDESGDADLLALMNERDMLFMNYECGREIQGEWAADARTIAPESEGCDCDVCAISRAFRKVVNTEPLSPFTSDKASVDRAIAYLADALMESGQEIGDYIEGKRREAHL